MKKSFQPKNLELRYKTYYSVLTIPKDVRVQLGKSRFFETTGTGNLQLAQSITIKKVIKWKSEIESVRNNHEHPIIKSSLELQRMEKNEKSVTKKQLIREIIDEQSQRIEREEGQFMSSIFNSVVTDESKVLREYLEPWKKHQIKRQITQKSIDQMYNDVEKMISYIPTTNLLDSSITIKWIKLISVNENLTPSSVNRVITSCRNFYKFLQFIEVIPENTVTPFIVPNEYKISKNPNSKSINKKEMWIPFEDREVVNLYQESVKKEDQTLSDLILIGCYTGMRIEEICSLKKNDVELNENFLKVVNSKTNAGIRTVPIHPKLKPRLKKLLEITDDEYILPNLTFNKYDDRSNSIGKRFGNLKKKLGYSDKKVFHSIRKTVTTQLENSYVNENITADILGHEKPRITYGQYSGGTNIKVKLDSIKKISYDFSKIEKSPVELKLELDKKYQQRQLFTKITKKSTPTKKTPRKTTSKTEKHT